MSANTAKTALGSSATPSMGRGAAAAAPAVKTLKDERTTAQASPRVAGPAARSGGPPSPRTKKASKTTLYDRFIPSRSDKELASSQFNLARGEGAQPLDGAAAAYQSEVARACGLSIGRRILSFTEEAPGGDSSGDVRALYSRTALKTSASVGSRRSIRTAPERVLDAPGIVEDYYLNLLDWSPANVLAIGLDQQVFLWNASTGDVSTLLTLAGDAYVASIKWMAGTSPYLAVGTSDGDVQIWDAESGARIRTMGGRQARVAALSWHAHVLSAGSRDGSIWNHDVRVARHKTAELVAHRGEVCGLTWRSDGALLASGANDNIVNIWDVRSLVPRFSITQHTAAVKALAWSPWELSLLASGGGLHDQHVHFWNTTTTARLNSINTGSQVTSIQWSPEYRELATAHGFPHNHLALWRYPSLTKIVDIPAHDTRVLHTAMSPDGETIATAASDDCLKFWRVFEARPKGALPKSREADVAPSSSAGYASIR